MLDLFSTDSPKPYLLVFPSPSNILDKEEKDGKDDCGTKEKGDKDQEGDTLWQNKEKKNGDIVSARNKELVRRGNEYNGTERTILKRRSLEKEG